MVRDCATTPGPLLAPSHGCSDRSFAPLGRALPAQTCVRRGAWCPWGPCKGRWGDASKTGVIGPPHVGWDDENLDFCEL